VKTPAYLMVFFPFLSMAAAPIAGRANERQWSQRTVPDAMMEAIVACECASWPGECSTPDLSEQSTRIPNGASHLRSDEPTKPSHAIVLHLPPTLTGKPTAATILVSESSNKTFRRCQSGSCFEPSQTVIQMYTLAELQELGCQMRDLVLNYQVGFVSKSEVAVSLNVQSFTDLCPEWSDTLVVKNLDFARYSIVQKDGKWTCRRPIRKAKSPARRRAG
jgi:hypothetical protein